MGSIKTKLFFSLALSACLLGIINYKTPFFHKKRPITIPVTFGAANIPQAQIEIQGNSYLLEIDLGSKFPLSLNPHILELLKKKPQGELSSRDVFGNTHTSMAYLLQNVKLGSLAFNNVLTKTDSEDYVSAITLSSEQPKNQKILENNLGTFGRPLLEDKSLFLDFPHLQISICDDIGDIELSGYHPEEFVAIPFTKGRTGLTLEVNTDLGKTRLSLDTGCTLSFIRAQDVASNITRKQENGLSYITSSIFTIESQDFGPKNLYLIEITPELHEIDGLLGMDFLKTHPVYIDPKNHLIYLGPAKRNANS